MQLLHYPSQRTENRYEAGMIEVALKEHLADKTNWRKMLQDDFEGEVDLADFRQKIKEYFPDDFQKFYRKEKSCGCLIILLKNRRKVSSFTLDKT